MKYYIIVIMTALLCTGCNQPAIQIDQPHVMSSSSSIANINQSQISSVKANTVTQNSSRTTQLAEYATYTNDDWKKVLTKEQYYILREAGTERPFTSSLLNEHRAGTFISADCHKPVFRSEQKFDSGTGWPSFYAPITPNAVIEKTDTSLFTTRTEVLSPCGGHLGHVFDDGPQPTGLRYCINGDGLLFIPDKE